VVGIPEESTDRRSTHQQSTRYQESNEGPDEGTIVLNVLQHLAAVDDVELPRAGRHRGEGRLLHGAPESFGLSNGRRRDVVTDGLSAELVQSDGEDPVHAAEVENSLSLRRKPSKQRALTPEQVPKTPIQVQSPGTLPVEP
jgi:hypothetical protein